MYSGEKSLKVFEYKMVNWKLNLTVSDTILEMPEVQIEYFGGIIKVVPKTSDIDEIIINDCTLTLGSLWTIKIIY